MKTAMSRALFFVCAMGIGATAVGESDALLERGTYLVESIAACGNCHSPKDSDTAEVIEGMAYAGSFMISETAYTAYAPNITADLETGIGGWTDEEIIVALRDGFRPDGSLIRPPMPIPFYRAISDYDVRAILAYLRTIKAVKNVVPKSEYNIPAPSNYGPNVESVPEVSKDDPVAYGKYVTHTLGHCTGCHTPRENMKLDFSRTNVGGRVFNNIYGLGFTAVSMNITPHPVAGIGEWTDGEIKRAITRGIGRNGRELAKVMAFPFYAKISEEDLDAIITYLRSLPPLTGLDAEGD
jgi:mono/diheme cytochrome c family protein